MSKPHHSYPCICLHVSPGPLWPQMKYNLILPVSLSYFTHTAVHRHAPRSSIELAPYLCRASSTSPQLLSSESQPSLQQMTSPNAKYFRDSRSRLQVSLKLDIWRFGSLCVGYRKSRCLIPGTAQS